MGNARVLVVDDEKNIRLTVTQSLESQGYAIETAVNGEEALAKLAEAPYDLMLLDLQMPGMNGDQVLAKAVEQQPQLQVVIVSAHGSVENAIEVMKLGAVDFLQKPFTPREIRALAKRVLSRSQLDAETASDYEGLLERARYYLTQHRPDEALETAKQALADNPDRPDAMVLIGQVEEMLGDRLEALKKYRAALNLDPTYKPAQDQLDRATA